MSSSSPALHPSWSPPPSSTFSLTGSTSPTSPMYPTLESQFCDRERDKIEAVAQQMQRCQHATDQMLSILSSFESKLTALETTMLPIHKGTQPLTTAQKNIDLSITETEKVISNYHVATESEEQIAERSISSDYQSYIAWVERINTALLFFQKNTTFKNQDRYVRKLRDLLKRAMLECEREFARLLDTNSRILDLERVGWPLPSNLELIPSGTLSQLTSIASCMSGSHNTSYIDLLKDRRRITLKKSFKAAIAWHDTVRQTSHPQDTWIHTPNIEERTITNTAAIGELKVGRYERGTHRGVFHIRIFARLCELEHLLLTSLLSHTSHSSYSEFDDTYSHIIGAALDKFMKEQAETLKETATVGPNKLLIALDMLENLNQTLPRYRAVFNKNSDFNRMLDFQDRVRDICRRSIMEYVTYVSTTSKDVNKNKSKDGTIHTITIETLNYLKRLHDYHTTIDGIPKADIHQPTTTDIPMRVTSLSITHTTNAQAMATSQNHIHEQHENESMTHLTGIILTALETNLTSRARGYKLDSLSAIFLLNNFHYIAKQLKKSDLDPGRQYTARYDALVLEAREQYKSASWDRLLSFIDLSDAATLLKRVPAAAAAAMSAVAALTTSPTMTTASLAGVTVPTTPSATTSTSHTLITVPKQVRKQIKAKYHGFNIEFQELHSTQTHFSVPDSDLRSQLRNHNVELIVNTYRHFNAMFSEVDFSTHRTKYIKYSPQVLETMINQFFDEQA